MKVLFVGLGAIGQRHLRNLVALEGNKVELLAYRSRGLATVLTDRMQVEPGTALEAKYGIRSYSNLEAALAQQPDVAFICNPSSLHLPAAIAAARAGCHLFIEKPLSNGLEGCAELAEIAHEKQRVVYVGYQMRFHPCLKRAMALLKAGAIGRPIAARVEVGEYLPGWHPYEDYRQSYAARHDLGGGTILSMIHEMDYLYWFLGLPRRIFTLGGHLSRLEVDVEDVASILMEFSAGGQRIPVHLHQDYVQRPPSRNCEMIGDAGKLLIDFMTLSLRCYNEQGLLVEDLSFADFQRNQLFIDQMTHFLACVRGEERPLVSLEDGLQSLRMALAARESLETGRVVELK